MLLSGVVCGHPCELGRGPVVGMERDVMSQRTCQKDLTCMVVAQQCIHSSAVDRELRISLRLVDVVLVHAIVVVFSCLSVGRELVESKTLEQENIVKESTIKIILIQSYGDILDLSVVSEINPTLKTYIRIEEGRKVTTLKEEIYKKFNCRPEKQHLTAVNERRPEKRRYLSDSSTIYEYQLDHEYKILVYYEFEGTLTFKHRISSDIFKLKIKSNSTIRQIKDKIREELQIGTVTEIYNQSNVKLNNDTSLADNHVTPSDVLEIELLGAFLVAMVTQFHFCVETFLSMV